MSVRMKLTHSKTASRRAHHGTKAPRLVVTKGAARRRHFVDPKTGMYRGKQIIAVGGEAPAPAKKPAKAKKADEGEKTAAKTTTKDK